MSWPMVKIGEICQTGSGGTPDRSRADYYGGSIPWVKSGELKGRVISSAEEALTEAGIKASSAKVVSPGAILIAMYGATVGRTAVLGIPAATNQAICHLIPDLSRINPDYLIHAVNHRVPEFIRQRVGGAQPNISQGIIRDTLIPLPPLCEQKRIASILDKTEHIRHLCERVTTYGDKLLKSVFKELVAKARVTDCCSVSPFGNVVKRIEAGTSVGGDDRILRLGEWGVLKVSAVTWGTFDADAYKAVSPDRVPTNPVIPKRGDLLFSRANTRELVGRTCIVHVDPERLFLPDKLWRIVPNPEKATAEFLHFALSDPQARFALTRTATGTSGSMLNISQSKLLDLAIPVPPIHMQVHFSRVVQHVLALRAAKLEQARQAERLSSSLDRIAFLGSLVK